MIKNCKTNKQTKKYTIAIYAAEKKAKPISHTNMSDLINTL